MIAGWLTVLDDDRTAPIGDAVKSAGWTDEALYDAITVCALFNFCNTWIDATRVGDMPAAAYVASRERLATSDMRHQSSAR
jgi:hypothetical protein